MDKIQIAIIALVCLVAILVIDNRLKINKIMQKKVSFEEDMPVYKEPMMDSIEEEEEEKNAEIED